MNKIFTLKVKRVLLTIATVAIFGVILFPPVVLFVTSIKTDIDALSFPPKWIFDPTLKNYVDILNTSPLVDYALNSLIVASLNTLLCLIVGSMAAYGLARFKFKGADNIAFWILSIRMMPPVAAIIPIYILMKNLGPVSYTHLTLPTTLPRCRSRWSPYH